MTPAARASRRRSSCSTRSSPPRASDGAAGRHARSPAISRPAAMPARRTGARSASWSSRDPPLRASGRPAGARRCSGWREDDPELLALFDGSPHGPAPIDDGEPVAERAARAGLAAKRLRSADRPDERPALLERAPLDLRVNALEGDARRGAAACCPDAAPTRVRRIGLRLPEGIAVEREPTPGATAWSRSRTRAASSSASACEAAPGMTRRRSVRRRRRQDAGARRRDGGRGPDRSPATPTAAGCRACAPRLARAGVVDRRDPAARSGPRGRGAGRSRGHGRSGAGRRALLGHRHLAAQSRDALAADAGAARTADRAAGAAARSRRRAGPARRARWSMRSARCSPRRAGTRRRR